MEQVWHYLDLHIHNKGIKLDKKILKSEYLYGDVELTPFSTNIMQERIDSASNVLTIEINKPLKEQDSYKLNVLHECIQFWRQMIKEHGDTK